MKKQIKILTLLTIFGASNVSLGSATSTAYRTQMTPTLIAGLCTAGAATAFCFWQALSNYSGMRKLKEAANSQNDTNKTSQVKTSLGRPSAEQISKFRPINTFIQHPDTYIRGDRVKSVDDAMCKLRQNIFPQPPNQRNKLDVFSSVEQAWDRTVQLYGHRYDPYPRSDVTGIFYDALCRDEPILRRVRQLRDAGTLNGEIQKSIVELQKVAKSFVDGNESFYMADAEPAPKPDVKKIKSHQNRAWGWTLCGLASVGAGVGAYYKFKK